MDVAPGWQSCYVALLECHLSNNRAYSHQPGASFSELQGSGGAVWTNAPFLWIHNSSLVGNKAASVGGAVFYITSALPVSHTLCCAVLCGAGLGMCVNKSIFKPIAQGCCCISLQLTLEGAADSVLLVLSYCVVLLGLPCRAIVQSSPPLLALAIVQTLPLPLPC